MVNAVAVLQPRDLCTSHLFLLFTAFSRFLIEKSGCPKLLFLLAWFGAQFIAMTLMVIDKKGC